MDKVLVRVYVPFIEEQFDVKIPLNRKIFSIIKLLSKGIYELSDGEFEKSEQHFLYDKLTGTEYNLNDTVKDTNIRNGKEIILV